MDRKYRRAAIVFLVLILAAGIGEGVSFFYFRSKISSLTLSKNKSTPVAENKNHTSRPVLSENNKFSVSGWLPYWAKTAGAVSVEKKLNLFNEINPFAYEVNPDGSLRDTAGLTAAPWSVLFATAKKNNVRIVPTVLWTDAAAMHRVFTNKTLEENNVAAIADMLTKNNFPGVDIDYEGKNIADRDNFSLFLKSLHEKLLPLGKTVECAVEARTTDQPPAGFTGARAMSWANDFSALDKYCDTVQLMAYDQTLQTERATSFDLPGDVPNAPNAALDWDREVIKYALRYIAASKLSLGVPTYGWEFKIFQVPGGWRYTEEKNLDYSEAMAEAAAAHATPARTDGGELSFIYQAADGKHLVTFEDATSIQSKIALAESLRLGGASFFKLDGAAPPGFYQTLAKTVK